MHFIPEHQGQMEKGIVSKENSLRAIILREFTLLILLSTNLIDIHIHIYSFLRMPPLSLSNCNEIRRDRIH